MLLIHGGDDGVGAAHRLVADVDGLSGLDIRQTVMVNDGQDLRLLNAGHCLGQLVVVHQHHLLTAGTEQMVTGQGAHHFFLLVQHGIAAIAAFQHHLPHVVYVVIQMEADQISGGTGPGDGDGLIDQPVNAAGVKGRGDNAGLAGVLHPFRIHVGLAQDQAGYLHVQRPADHIRLAAAQHDAVRAVKQQVFTALGQGDGHAAGQTVHQITALAHHAALDDAQQVEHGHLLHHRIGDGVQAEGGNVAGGQHSVQGAVLVGHGNGGDLLAAHQLPRPVHGDRGVQTGGTVKVQIPHLRAHVLDKAGRLEAEVLQHPVGLVADGAQMHRHILLLAQRVLQRRIGHGGHNGVGIRIAMAGHIDLVHTS